MLKRSGIIPLRNALILKPFKITSVTCHLLAGREGDGRVSHGNEFCTHQEDWGTGRSCDCAVTIKELDKRDKRFEQALIKLNSAVTPTPINFNIL